MVWARKHNTQKSHPSCVGATNWGQTEDVGKPTQKKKNQLDVCDALEYGVTRFCGYTTLWWNWAGNLTLECIHLNKGHGKLQSSMGKGKPGCLYREKQVGESKLTRREQRGSRVDSRNKRTEKNVGGARGGASFRGGLSVGGGIPTKTKKTKGTRDQHNQWKFFANLVYAMIITV